MYDWMEHAWTRAEIRDLTEWFLKNVPETKTNVAATEDVKKALVEVHVKSPTTHTEGSKDRMRVVKVVDKKKEAVN